VLRQGENTMAELWYYTQEGLAQDPVTKAELQQLAGSGLLKPNDLVWTEGMPQWIRASVAGGLFAEEILTATDRSTAWDFSRPRHSSSAYDVDSSAEEARIRRRPDEDERTAIDDDAYEQPARRRRGLSSGAKAGIVAGVVVAVLVVVGVVLLAVLGGGSNTRSFSLAEGQSQNFQLPFKAGNKVEIWVKSTGQSDVDLYVYDANNRLVEFDDGDSSDCYVRFLAGKNQTFRVEVRNERRGDQQWRNGHNSGTLTFKEGPLAPGEIPPDEYTNRQPWFKNQANRPVFNPGIEGPFNPPGFKGPGIQPPGFKRPNRPPFNQRP
jgi:hypothetical protein